MRKDVLKLMFEERKRVNSRLKDLKERLDVHEKTSKRRKIQVPRKTQVNRFLFYFTSLSVFLTKLMGKTD